MQQIWKYLDATNTERLGAFLNFTDFGGTDVTYKFHRLGDDGLPIMLPNGGKVTDLVSGYRLRDHAERVGAVETGKPFFLK